MELNPARERLPADSLEPRQIPELKLIVLAEAGRVIGMILDHDAAGPGVSDVQDEIDVDMVAALLILDDGYVRNDGLLMDNGEKVQVVLLVLPVLYVKVNVDLLADLGIAAAQAAALVDIPYPAVNPLAGLQVPVIVAGVAGKGEAVAVPDVLRDRYA